MSDSSSEFDMDSPYGRANYRVHHAMRAWDLARDRHGLSHDEMRDATTRYPFRFRDTDAYDMSSPEGRGNYRAGLFSDMMGSAGRYNENRGGYSRVWEDPQWDCGYFGGYRPRRRYW